jgi:hypothetical protein
MAAIPCPDRLDYSSSRTRNLLAPIGLQLFDRTAFVNADVGMPGLNKLKANEQLSSRMRSVWERLTTEALRWEDVFGADNAPTDDIAMGEALMRALTRDGCDSSKVKQHFVDWQSYLRNLQGWNSRASKEQPLRGYIRKI